MPFNRIHSITAILVLTATLTVSCIHDPYFKEDPINSAYRNAPTSILVNGRVSRASKQTLKAMRRENKTDPTNITERIAVAEDEISQARKAVKSSRFTAASHYLNAAAILWPVVKDTTIPETKPFNQEQKQRLVAHQLHTHAVGQTARHLVNIKAIKHGQKSIRVGNHLLAINTTSPNTIHPSYFDHLNPLDTYHYDNVGPHHYKKPGFGIATNGHRNWTEARAKSNQILPPYGMDIPVNLLIDSQKPGKLRLTLTNLLKTDTITLNGKKHQLAGDYSAPIAAMMDSQSSFLGLMIAMNPKKYKVDKGLFAIGPYDPDKIPVIFIHGLISQPSTWTITTNRLLQDKTIRENYQFYYYFYPTGVTPVVSGTKLRKTLLEFYESHDNHGHNKLNRTVLIGHSMGGILTSIQSRKFDKKLWDSLFKKTSPSDQAKDPNKIYRTLFEPAVLPQIERAIFVSTPHRGSKLANGWIGGIGAALIEIPQKIITLQLGATLNSMTDLGRSLLSTNGRPDSINRLKPDNPALTILNKQPFSKRVTYHSIMGDRGKGDTPDSSDGVVPYWSSHLDGAASEKIVPTNHEAQLHPMANDEILRILHLHLKK